MPKRTYFFKQAQNGEFGLPVSSGYSMCGACGAEPLEQGQPHLRANGLTVCEPLRDGDPPDAPLPTTYEPGALHNHGAAQRAFIEKAQSAHKAAEDAKAAEVAAAAKEAEAPAPAPASATPQTDAAKAPPQPLGSQPPPAQE